MAGTARLNAGSRRRLLALLVLVLLAHAVALDWLARQLAQQSSILRQMPAPMLTRLLQPEPAVPVVAAPPPAAVAVPARPAVTSIARKKTPARPKPAASAAEEAVPAKAPEPQPDPAAVAAAPSASEPEPVPPAPPPQASASAPLPAASEVAASTGTSTPTASTGPESAAGAASNGRDPDGWPVATRLNYRLGGMYRHGELHGDARVQWQRLDQRYQTRVEIDITLLARLVMTSQGEVTPQGLKPDAYEEQRRSGPRTARMTDDTIVLSDGRRVPRPAGVQDTASQFVELTHRFASGREPLEVGRSIDLWMARPGGVDLWTYDVVSLDRLRMPEFGVIEAFHLVPRAILKPRGNITAEIWFAPSLQYLPVRIKVNMGEETYVDLMVEKIEQQ